MRVDHIEFVREVSRMRSETRVAEMIRDETDIDRATILSHRMSELREAKKENPNV